MPDNIIMRYDMRMSAPEEAEIMIFGAIISHKYREDSPDVTAKDFDKLVKDAKGQGAKTLTLRINSGGGIVDQAVAMRSMLVAAGFDKVNVRIEGLCASAATLPICIPGAHVTIFAGANLMIHNPMCGNWGNAATMEETAKYLRQREDDFRKIYANRTGKSEEQIKQWMDAETWFSADQAVEAGFADEVYAEGNEAVACVDTDTYELLRGMYANTPSMQVAAAANPNPPPKEPEGQTNKEDEDTMEIKDITVEQLRAENPALYNQIMQAGAANEAERISEIRELTLPGYEDLAENAIANGTSAMDFHKEIVAASKKKGETFMQQRKGETAMSGKVTGGDPGTNDGKEDYSAHAKEMAEYAASMSGSGVAMY